MSAPKKQNEEIEWVYESVLTYIKDPLFRIPIKDFIDENCILFDDSEENSFEHTKIHNKFKKMIETLLESLLIDLGITQEQFVKAAAFGLESENKKYFEQLVACDNYIYVKNLMVKRNLQIQEESYKLMYGNKKELKVENKNISSGDSQNLLNKDKDYQDLLKKQEEKELETALQLSLIIEDEKKKLALIEEEEYKIALGLSKSLANQEDEQEISLFDPSTLVKKNNDSNPTHQKSQPIQTKHNPKPIPQNQFNIPNDFTFPDSHEKPQVSSVKKETDFSYLKTTSNQVKSSELPENHTIEKTEKIVFDKPQEPSKVIESSFNLINLEDVKGESQVSVNEPSHAVVPEVIQTIPVVSSLKVSKPETQNIIDLNPSNNLPQKNQVNEQDQKVQTTNQIINSLFEEQKQDKKLSQSIIHPQSNNTETNNAYKGISIFEGNTPSLFEANPNVANNYLNNSDTKKISLGEVKVKKAPHNEIQKPYEKNVKESKQVAPQTSAGVEEPTLSPDELQKKFDEIQKEKADKLKEYRAMVLMKKKEKREEKKVEEEKIDEKSSLDSMLSDEVKKRLEMRKGLAEKLANFNKNK